MKALIAFLLALVLCACEETGMSNASAIIVDGQTVTITCRGGFLPDVTANNGGVHACLEVRCRAVELKP